jgi:Cdc6-like AAA superfamily ATPase
LKLGVLSLFNSDELEYKKILAQNIGNYQNDQDLTIRKLISTLLNENGKELIVVLDNCDKRNADDQLLMFEVANWMKNEFKTIVFLPLRDTTYENHRYNKPLDTGHQRFDIQN